MTPEEKQPLVIDDASVRDIVVSDSDDGVDDVDDRQTVNPTMHENPPQPKSRWS